MRELPNMNGQSMTDPKQKPDLTGDVNGAATGPDRQDVGAEEGDGERVEQDLAAESEDLARLQEEVARLTDRHLRLAAEFDNYRKRVERERVETSLRAQAEVASRLLDTLDDLERVSHHADAPNARTLIEGVQLIEKKLFTTLQSLGLEPVDAEGKPFDPTSMEAIAMVPTDQPDEDHRVADVFQRGYWFKGLLIRPARVRVKQYEG